MDGTTLLVTVLSMVGVRLPVLIALCVGLVWVVGAPRDATRTGALVGLLLLLLASLGGMAAGSWVWGQAVVHFGAEQALIISALGSTLPLSATGLIMAKETKNMKVMAFSELNRRAENISKSGSGSSSNIAGCLVLRPQTRG